MRILPADSTGIAEALATLRAGGVVAHATETCYGLACDLRNPKAVEKLFLIKDRPFNQPVSALFPSVEEAKKYVEWNDEAEKLAKQHLPGPLTIILRMRQDSPEKLLIIPQSDVRSAMSDERERLTAHSSQLAASIGVRVSPQKTALRLVTEFGSPLSTTSANIHGMLNPYSPQDIWSQFEGLEIIPDIVLDDGMLPKTPPSTVMDLTTSEKTVRRSGTVGI